MERFQEDRTTLLYFYQQVRGGPAGLLGLPTLQIQEDASSSPAQKKLFSRSPKTLVALLPSHRAAEPLQPPTRGQLLWSHPTAGSGIAGPNPFISLLSLLHPRAGCGRVWTP